MFILGRFAPKYPVFFSLIQRLRHIVNFLNNTFSVSIMLIMKFNFDLTMKCSSQSKESYNQQISSRKNFAKPFNNKRNTIVEKYYLIF
jgi:hypothetical protein